ncbi:MAG: long-chain fatty acid--CoA ligase [Betaproteobacteria bacterium]|nr:long-chain fatty acid--CoA ligase [Betaproteobacteria bacterium]
MSIASLLVASARTHPDCRAISVGATVYSTYRRFHARVAGLAAGLRKLAGGVPGERIAIVSANCPEYMEVMWAAWHAGLCIVPVNARLHPREVAWILDNCGAVACFVSADLLESIAPLQAELDRLKHLVCVTSAEYEALAASPVMPHAEVDGEAPAWLFYTSGTTGKPKGATLSHRNLLAMTLRNYADIEQYSSDDSILHVAPFSHASGLFSLALVAKASNHVIPESRGFQEAELFDLIAAYPRSTLFLAPTMLNRLARHPGSALARVDHLRTLIYGGAPMYLEDTKRALNAFGPCLWQGYGQGETPNTIAFLSKAWHAAVDHPRYEQMLATVGVPRTGVDVRVAGASDESLPAGEIGEIIVRSEVTMSGYWNNPEASAKTLSGGWLHTGDLGCFDEFGFLSLKDRSKDVIISGGSNIYPREVEEVILLHPDVLETAVVGRPSAEWGEEVVAFVVARGDTVPGAELDKLCLDNIARFKRPKQYRFIDSLPKNNYGKILKTELRVLAAKD